jgi:hypothetical protein
VVYLTRCSHPFHLRQATVEVELRQPMVANPQSQCKSLSYPAWAGSAVKDCEGRCETQGAAPPAHTRTVGSCVSSLVVGGQVSTAIATPCSSNPVMQASNMSLRPKLRRAVTWTTGSGQCGTAWP